ncbi:MAG: GHKL domain-containing protein [Eubacteriales bacterium]|nr:GHKL domain-containing protein [Eubacteriales bacterium]
MFDVITTLCTNLLRIYVTHRFMVLFFKTDILEKKTEYFSYIMFWALTSGVHLAFHSPPANMTVNILLLYLIARQYEGSQGKKIFVILLVYGINAGCDFLAVYGLTNYAVTQTFHEGIAYVSVFLIVVSEFIIERILVKNRGNQNIPHWNILLVIACVSIGMMNLLMRINTQNRWPLVLLSAGLIVVDLLIFYLYDVLVSSYQKAEERALFEKQMLIYSNQLDVLAQSEEKVKSLRHDMKNHLRELAVMADHHQYEKIIDYIDDMEGYMKNPHELVSTGNKSLDGLLNYFLGQAKQCLDRVDYDVCVPENLNIAAIDLNIIIGNLFDNAIEAASHADSRWLTLSIDYEKGMFSIVIRNSFRHELRKKEKKYLSTKKEKGHGIGLENVKKAVEQYHGAMEFADDDNVFEVRVMLYI